MESSNGNGNSGGGVPPGFRFHPTDEELLHYYLKKKLSFHKFDMEVVREVDLNKIEPWQLHERCNIGSAPQNEWYFFSHKDRKYPTGSRTNRATNAGFWKATGRDKSIRNSLMKIGMRKTLVFYRGRAPHGQKTDWIMHEYRLEDQGNPDDTPEDGWVICKVFKKKNLFKVGTGNGEASSTPNSYDDHQLLLNDDDHNKHMHNHHHHHHHQYMLHEHEDHMATHNNYSNNIPPPHNFSQYQPLDFLPLPSFHKQNLPLTTTCNNDISALSPQLMISTVRDHHHHHRENDPNNICYQAFDSGILMEAQTCDYLASRAGGADHSGTGGDEPNLSKWAMVDPPQLASYPQPEYGNHDDDGGRHNHEDDDVNASSMAHIGPLSLRGEIELWGPKN